MGSVSSEQVAYSVSGAGDVNGDGINDVIVGASNNDIGGNNAGGAYVIFGKSGTARAVIDTRTLPPGDGFFIQGNANDDFAGSSVSGAGDINGDGIDDLIVGAKRSSDGGAMAGQAYVIYGKNGATRANRNIPSPLDSMK